MITGLSVVAAIGCLAFAGEPSSSQKWREIVPLVSTREDVIKLLGAPSDGERGALAVYKMTSEEIIFEYARGYMDDEACSDRFAEGTVMSVRWTPNQPVPEASLEWELGTFLRSAVKEEESAVEILHDEQRGIVAKVIDDEVEWVLYLAPTAQGGRCSRFYRSDPLEYFIAPIAGHVSALCRGLRLDHPEVQAGDSVGIVADVLNPGGDPLTFAYIVTGGRILGSGPKVSWDTTGLAPGSYEVRAAVEDGYNPPTDCSATLTVRKPPHQP